MIKTIRTIIKPPQDHHTIPQKTIEENLEDDIDWWSKFYASLGEVDKCSKYLEHGYDKIQVWFGEGFWVVLFIYL